MLRTKAATAAAAAEKKQVIKLWTPPHYLWQSNDERRRARPHVPTLTRPTLSKVAWECFVVCEIRSFFVRPFDGEWDEFRRSSWKPATEHKVFFGSYWKYFVKLFWYWMLEKKRRQEKKKIGEEAQCEGNVGKTRAKVPYILQLITGKMEDVNYCSILIRAHGSKKTTMTTRAKSRRKKNCNEIKLVAKWRITCTVFFCTDFHPVPRSIR